MNDTAHLSPGATSGGGAGVPLTFLAKAGSASSDGTYTSATKQLPLFTNVRLVSSVSVEGERLAAGASGTIVERLGSSEAYVVEFFQPRHCVVTIYDSALKEDR